VTWALCLNCGEVKFGAICPCPKCNVESTGDMNLDIAFSDHHMAKETAAILPFAKEALDIGERGALGERMAARRRAQA